jgi:hypothetical protein
MWLAVPGYQPCRLKFHTFAISQQINEFGAPSESSSFGPRCALCFFVKRLLWVERKPRSNHRMYGCK